MLPLQQAIIKMASHGITFLDRPCRLEIVDASRLRQKSFSLLSTRGGGE